MSRSGGTFKHLRRWRDRSRDLRTSTLDERCPASKRRFDRSASKDQNVAKFGPRSLHLQNVKLMLSRFTTACLFLLCVLLSSTTAVNGADKRPNVVIILS